jgi:hypothetical protein
MTTMMGWESEGQWWATTQPDDASGVVWPNRELFYFYFILLVCY